MTHKIAREYGTRTNLSKAWSLRRNTRVLVMYEIVRIVFGQNVNKYFWKAVDVERIEGFSSQDNMWVAQVYSRLAQIALLWCPDGPRELQDGVEWLTKELAFHVFPSLHPFATDPSLEPLAALVVELWDDEQIRRKIARKKQKQAKKAAAKRRRLRNRDRVSSPQDAESDGDASDSTEYVYASNGWSDGDSQEESDEEEEVEEEEEEEEDDDNDDDDDGWSTTDDE